jgi:hypothetical protein
MGLAAGAALLIVAGGIFAIGAGRSTPPAFPAAPPGAHRLWASQTADMLQANQVLSVALYRVPAPPAAVIAFYRHGPGGRSNAGGRFSDIIRRGTPAALPTALQHLPAVFVDGKGASARADYAYTEYAVGGSDVGIAVDLRHPRGPTLVFVEMLSG